MSDAEQIRLRAARLFALALKAREDGKLDYAEELTKLASEAFDHATRLEATAPPMPPAQAPPQQPTQQQQPPQPDPDKKE
jgi:hypothetical protein